MKPYIVVIISLVLVIGYANISIDTGRCKTDKYDNWDVFSCPCSGGSGDYDYQYSKLPVGWYANKDKLYIPKNKIERNKYYPFKMSIFDRKDNREAYKKSIVFNYEDQNRIGKVVDADYDFDFDDSRAFDDFIRDRFRFVSDARSNQIIPDIDRDRVDRDRVVNFQSSRVITRDDRVVDRTVIVDDNRYVRDNRDIQERRAYIFASEEQIQTALERAETRRIREIIKSVVDSDQNCKAKSQFLQKLQGKIQVRITIFRSDAEKNRQAIVDLTTEIKNMKEQLDKYSRRGIDSDAYNERVRGYRTQIQRHSRDREGFDSDTRRSREAINRYRSEIQGHKSSTSESRRQAEIEERKMTEIDVKIADLEQRLKVLKRQRDDCRGRRDRHRSVCTDFDRKIEQCNRKIKTEEETIDGCERKSRTCLNAINDFNKKLQECNKQFEGMSFKQKIAEIKSKISQNQEHIQRSTREVERLTSLYTDIEKDQNDFESLISRHYYSCYQYAPVNNNNYEYTAPSSAFLNYMKDIFGQVPNENIRARFSGTVSIKKNSIFSPAWTKVYGIPYTAGYGSNRDLNDDNFSCTESSDNLKVFSGKIEDINKNVLTVLSKSGDRYTVHLGGCTRIQSISDREVPEKGSEIYFKGLERPDKHYNGFHVTCY